MFICGARKASCTKRLTLFARLNSTVSPKQPSVSHQELYNQEKYNAITTLPTKLSPRRVIFQKVLADNGNKESPIVFAKQWFTYAKEIVLFYKLGLKNIWHNRKLKNQLLREKFHIDLINYTSKESSVVGEDGIRTKIVKGQINNGRDLTKYLLNEIYIRQIEMKKNGADQGKYQLTNISRSEYQLILRTEKDFMKLPLFGLIFLIFAETTPLVCLLVPSLIPTTCILPFLIKRQEIKKIHLMEKAIGDARKSLGSEVIEDFFKKGNLYELSTKELGFLHKFFGLSFWKRITRSSTLKSLIEYRNEILVDNHLIMDNNPEGFGKLNPIELLFSGNKRGLISRDIIQDVNVFNDGHDYGEGIDKDLLVAKMNQFAKDTKFQI